MKNILKFLVIAVLVVGFAACEDENEKTPEGSQQIDVPYVHVPNQQDSISYPLEIGLDVNGNSITAADWMSALKDDQHVSKVSIPGTHDALTGMGFYDGLLKYIFNMTAISQVATLQEQLEGGIRFFDVRPVVSTDTLTKAKVLRCAHGISEISVTFEESLEMLASFLEAHPTEFAIFKIQNDNGVENQMKFIPMMKEVLDRVNNAHNGILFNDWRPDVTVGELRGKILILNRVAYDIPNMYGAFGEWPDEDPDGDLHKNGEKVNLANETSLTIMGVKDTLAIRCPMYVQDYYKTNESSIQGFSRLEEKKSAVKNLMAASRRVSDAEDVWIVNHCSAYTEVSPRGYATNAAAVHPVVIADILANPCTNIGTIAMDFACYDRVNVIINGGTPYSSDYIFNMNPLSRSLANLVIMNNFPEYFTQEYISRHKQ